MKVCCWLYIPLIILFCSCQNSSRNNFSQTHSNTGETAGWENQISGGAFQVTADEYKDNFESRFGLLHLKSENVPFNGRILTVGVGDNGEYISSDESWKDGRKDGKSSKWFSNGVKMYERNYKRGKWHGTVTRWWPNGQKMYVRAYSYGARHGKEATWRSDGTPITLPANGLPSTMQSTSQESSLSFGKSNGLPQSDSGIETESTSTDSKGDDSFSIQPPSSEFGENTSLTSEEDSGNLPPLNDGFESLSFPESVTPDSEPSTADDLPNLSNSDLALPEVGDEDELPKLSPLPDENNEPVIEDSLPPLPPVEADANDLPPLPGDNNDDGLPPLPSESGSGFDDLPPLPPLP
ncbi:hypothetical protein N9A58_02050 [Opitutales bacterium]|nr:hypothetical protein [Opitutales bacterium]